MTGAQVVLGAMNYGTTVDERRAVELLDTFVEHGGTWIDTADCYSFWNDPSGVGGASEQVLGSWFAARPRARVKISTKVRHQPLVPHRWPESAEGLSAGAIRQGVAGSLERLGVESVDLLWAHAEDRTVALEETVATPERVAERTGLTLDTLRYYKREGLIGRQDRVLLGRLTLMWLRGPGRRPAPPTRCAPPPAIPRASPSGARPP
jgi:aryl-alcohol dehydrogenase-like predicted oxidoreductase